MKLRIGIIGLGETWESRHLPALRALGDRFEVGAICDPVARRAQVAARELHTRPVEGFRAVAEQEDLDAVVILSAEWFGELPILAACASRKAVYCAAPLEIDIDRAATLRRRVQQAGIAFVAELSCRHAPATLRLKELIATRLGPPRLLFSVQRQTAAAAAEQARTISMNRLIHAVDWCRYVIDAEPTSVSGVSHSASGRAATSDFLMMSLDFSDPDRPGTGPQAHISWDGYVPPACREAVSFRAPANLQVVCERGIAFVDLPDKLIWFDDAGQHTESLDRDRPVDEQLLLHFHRAVTSLVLNSSGLEDAHRALEIIHHARQSEAARRWVAIGPPDGRV